HVFAVLLELSLESGLKPNILWQPSIFVGMIPREIEGHIRYGWETCDAICARKPLETCHDTPERIEQSKRFDKLPAYEQGFLRYAMNGRLDTTLFAQLER